MSWRDTLPSWWEALALDPDDAIVVMHEPFDPDLLLRPKPQQKTRPKPEGFWYALGDTWLSWMSTDAQEWLEEVKHIYKLTLDKSNFVLLRSVEDIDDFDATWGTYAHNASLRHIDWGAVAKQHSGIEIAPYQWDRRLEGRASMWYYGWDVASGCVWSRDAVLTVEEVADPKLIARLKRQENVA